MDFSDTPATAAFRREVRAWLEANAPGRRTSVSRQNRVTAEDVARARAWQRHKLAAGYAGLTWPAEHGGRGMPLANLLVWHQESSRFDLPEEPLIGGEMLAGPTIVDHGTTAQQRAHLPAILDGSALWCQLFSAPDAGSDLAGTGPA